MKSQSVFSAFYCLLSLVPILSSAQSSVDIAAGLHERGIYFDQQFERDSAAYYFQQAAEWYAKGEDWESCIHNYVVAMARYHSGRNAESSYALISVVEPLLNTHLPNDLEKLANFHAICFTIYLTQGEMDKMKHHARLAQDYFLAIPSDLSASQSHQLAISYRVLEEYEEAIRHCLKTLELVGSDSTSTALTLQFLAKQTLYSIYLEKGNVRMMEWAMEGLKELAILTNRPQFVEEWELDLGLVHQYKGDWQRALEHFRLAPKIPTTCSNMCRVFQKMGQYDSAELYLLQGLTLTKDKPRYIDQRAVMVLQAVNFYFFGPKKDENKVSANLREAKRISQQLGSAIYQANLDYIEGNIAFEQKNVGKATTLAQKSLGAYTFLHLGEEVHQSFVLDLLGKIALHHQRLDSAEYWLLRGISTLTPNSQNLSVDRLPGFSESLAPGNYLGILMKLRHVYQKRFETSQLPQDLKTALRLSLKGHAIFDTLQIQIKRTASRELWTEESADYFSTSIDLAYQLYSLTKETQYIDMAFQLAEKSKNQLLRESIQQEQALVVGNLPDSIRQKEASLLSDLIYAREIYLTKQGDKQIDEQDLAYSSSLHTQANEVYVQFQEYLDQQYPAYFSLKYQNKLSSITEVQRFLQQNSSTLLEYHQAKEAIYLICIDAKDKSFYKIPWGADQSRPLSEFLHSLHFTPKSLAEKELVSLAYPLYSSLFSPILSQHPHPTKLLIIPDGQLGFLPFELLSREPVISPSSYLLSHYPIQYATTAHHLLQAKNKSSTLSFAGFAPTYATSQKLLFNQPEVQAIQTLIGGKVYLGQAATEHHFRQISSSNKVLHLAMHGYPNETDPFYSYLLFSPDHAEDDGKLHAYEIYNMDIPASMVVLSACHTGYGPIAKGEGIRSLSRAFAYAGCHSVVMSLWEADGRAANELMQYFYSYLGQNYPKDEALRQAKLDFIASAPPDQQHPRHWANFVVMGDVSPLEKDGPVSTCLWISILLIGLIGFIGLRKIALRKDEPFAKLN
ncbi:MAG: CHAT domain-containing tetratricopeptide repeat protein [Bacteroidota bacterium]